MGEWFYPEITQLVAKRQDLRLKSYYTNSVFILEFNDAAASGSYDVPARITVSTLLT